MTATTATFVRKPMSSLQQALLSFFWLATNIHWTTILIVTMPSQIRDAVGNDAKGTFLGLALAFGAIVSMVAAPAFGALSDRIKLPGGRRKPWVVIGTLGNILGGVVLTVTGAVQKPESQYRH